MTENIVTEEVTQKPKDDLGTFAEYDDKAKTLENVTDQEYLAQIALDEQIDNQMRVIAVRKLNDITILEKFASIPDSEANQFYYRNGKRLYETKEEMTKPFNMGQLRNAARVRISELIEQRFQ